MLKFTEDHEWIMLDGARARVGITAYAQKALGDVVFVELPPVGRVVKAGDEVAVVESVKAASEVYAPLDGTILSVNQALESEPSLVNGDPTGDGWFFEMSLEDPAAVEGLMDQAAYDAFIEGL